MVSFVNRVRVNTATTGTGTVTLGSATSNAYATAAEAGLSNGATVTYLIEDNFTSGVPADFEIGTGVYTSSGTTLTRATVLLSKISGTSGTTKLTLSGSAVVSIIVSAEDLTAFHSGTLAVASGGTGQTTEAEALGEMTQALTAQTPARTADYLMFYDASLDTGSKALISDIADVANDTSPTLGGDLDVSTFNLLIPDSDGTSYNAPFSFRSASTGCKIFELRSGNWRPGIGAPTLNLEAYVYASNSPYHGECYIGVDSAPDPANPHHTRLGIASVSGDPVSIHYGIEETVAGTGLNDYPITYITSVSPNTATWSFNPILYIATDRLNGLAQNGFESQGSIHFVGPDTAGNTTEYGGFSCVATDSTDASEDAYMWLRARVGGTYTEQLAVANGVLIGGIYSVANQPGYGNLGFYQSAASIKDPNANELIKFTATVAAAVNEITVTNAATGNAPSLSATGNDTNINLTLAAKGTGVVKGHNESFVIAASDETTALTTGTGKITFRMPYAFTLTGIRASLSTAQTSGSIFTVDVNESGTTLLSTKLTIDNTEKTSTTALTPAVISDSAIADDAEITVDIDQIGDGTAKGLKVYLIGHQ